MRCPEASSPDNLRFHPPTSSGSAQVLRQAQHRYFVRLSTGTNSFPGRGGQAGSHLSCAGAHPAGAVTRRLKLPPAGSRGVSNIAYRQQRLIRRCCFVSRRAQSNCLGDIMKLRGARQRGVSHRGFPPGNFRTYARSKPDWDCAGGTFSERSLTAG